jgi:hypothetical protein
MRAALCLSLEKTLEDNLKVKTGQSEILKFQTKQSFHVACIWALSMACKSMAKKRKVKMAHRIEWDGPKENPLEMI